MIKINDKNYLSIPEIQIYFLDKYNKKISRQTLHWKCKKVWRENVQKIKIGKYNHYHVEENFAKAFLEKFYQRKYKKPPQVV